MTVRLIVGCGYLGSRVAARWAAAGDEVHVTSRSETGAARWRAAGYRAVVADVTDPASLRALPAADTVLVAYGFDRSAGRSLHEVYVDGFARLLDALTTPPRRLIYVSSTGVYGEAGGERVDEGTPCEPTREGGVACLEAERRLVAHPLGNVAIRLRLAGIYGPGRIPLLAALASGAPLATAPDHWLNLIHVDDAADTVCWAADASPAPELYVVSDGRPVPRCEFYAEAARAAGAPPPTFAAVESGAASGRRASGGDKRVDSSKLWGTRGAAPRFPSYREGLADALHGAP